MKHGADVGSHGLKGFIMALGYLLLEGRDPLLRPSTLEKHLRLVSGRGVCGWISRRRVSRKRRRRSPALTARGRWW